MSRESELEQLRAQGFEPVHIELEWYDEHHDRVERQLSPHRVAPPGASILRASWRPLVRGVRYRPEGLDIVVGWSAPGTPGAD